MTTGDLVAVAGTLLVGLALGHGINRLALGYSRDAGQHDQHDQHDQHAHRHTAVRVPVVELLTAAAAVLVLFRFGLAAATPAWWWFTAVGLLLAVVDLRTMLLPNRIVLPGAGVALALLGLAAVRTEDGASLLRAVLAGFAALGVLLVLALISPASLGFGDVKLAALLGLMLGWLSWPATILGFLIGSILQALASLAALALRRAGRRTDLPFGPALIAGTLLAALLSGPWRLLG